MSYRYPAAQQLAEKVARIKGGEGTGTVEELVEWYERFGHRYPAAQRVEIADALGIAKDIKDVPFREIVPEGWLSHLLELVSESESPSPFYFLASLSVLSQAIGRKVMIDRGTHRLGLDVSALLISPAGRGRRSTACDFVVYEIGEEAGINVIADSFSYEAFGDALVESAGEGKVPADRRIMGPKALIYAGEMSTLLGKGSYADSIIPKLTDIIGKTSRFEWRTVKRGGKLAFHAPCVNACFTSAPDWLVDNLPPIVFGGGMLSRFLICVQDQMEQVVTWGAKLSDSRKMESINWLRRLMRLEGTFGKPEGRAYKWYDEWYQSHSKKYLSGDVPDERMGPYFSRKHDHLLRVTALLTLAAGEPMTFTVQKFDEALRILDWLERDVPKAYARMALNPIAGAQMAVCEILKKNGGLMEHSRLQRKMFRHTPLREQFNSVVESLISMRVVRPVPSLAGKGKSYHLVSTLEE